MNNKINKDIWVYFSHNKQTYNTLEEKLIYNYLLTKFSKLVVPNIGLPDLNSMETYLKIVENCDLLVVAEFNDYLGKGSYREVQRAFEKNILVKVIRPFGKSYRMYSLRPEKLEIYDEDDWQFKFARIK